MSAATAAKHGCCHVVMLLVLGLALASAHSHDVHSHDMRGHHHDHAAHNHHGHSHEDAHEHAALPLQLTAADVAKLAALLSHATAGAGHDEDHHHHHHHHHGSHSHAHSHSHGDHDAHSLSVADVLKSVGAAPAAQLTDAQAVSAVSHLMRCAADPHCSLASSQQQVDAQVQGGAAGDQTSAAAATGVARLFSWLRPAPGGAVSGATKAGAALLLFVETVVGLLLPPLISRMEGHTWWLSLLNCFAGGIFLTAGLMHLVPHCEEAQMSVDITQWGLPAHYPLYLLLICAGYLLVFAAERVLFEGHDHGHGHSHGHHHHHSHSHSHDHHSCGAQDSDTEGTLLAGAGHDAQRKESGVRKRKPASSHAPEAAAASHAHAHGSHAAHGATGSQFSVAKGLPLLVGMSVHTGLECLALGLMNRHAPFLILFTAIAAHKGVSALALSARFTRAGANLHQVLLLVGPFCFIAPSFIAVGHWAGNVLPPGLQLLLNCLAAGTFLYVGASEILAEEFEGDAAHGAPWGLGSAAARGVKFLCVLVAVGCIAALGLMPHVH